MGTLLKMFLSETASQNPHFKTENLEGLYKKKCRPSKKSKRRLENPRRRKETLIFFKKKI